MRQLRARVEALALKMSMVLRAANLPDPITTMLRAQLASGSPPRTPTTPKRAERARRTLEERLACTGRAQS